MINNEPKWVDVSCDGETTCDSEGNPTKYFGRFYIKPYLSHEEKTDASRLSELYSRGIVMDDVRRSFNTTLAYLRFHIVKSDCSWWTDKAGLDLMDEEPVYRLADAVRSVQRPAKKDEAKPKDAE